MFSVFYKSYNGVFDKISDIWYLSESSAEYAAIAFLKARKGYKYAVILGPEHTDIKIIEATNKK